MSTETMTAAQVSAPIQAAISACYRLALHHTEYTLDAFCQALCETLRRDGGFEAVQIHISRGASCSQNDKPALAVSPAPPDLLLPLQVEWLSLGNVQLHGWQYGALSTADVEALMNMASEIAAVIGLLTTFHHRRPEDELATILQNVDDALWSWSPRLHHFLYVSPSTEKLIGYTRGEILGREVDITDLLPSEAYKRLLNMIEAHKGPDHIRIRHRIKRADGQISRVESHLSFHTQPEGDLRVDGITHDLTDISRLQAQARRREQRFAYLLDNAFDLIILLDAEGLPRWVSRSAQRVLGYTPEELQLLAQDFGQIHDEDRPLAQRMLRELMSAEGATRNFTLRAIHEDGHTVWLEVTAQNHLADPALHAVVLNARDITESQQVEQELLLSEARYRDMVEQQVEMVGLSGPDGRLIYANQAFCNFLRLPREEVIGQYQVSEYIHPEDRDRVVQHFASLSPAHQAGMIEYRMFTPDGRLRWVQWTNRLITGDQDEGPRFQGVGRDVTNAREAEQRLRLALEASRAGIWEWHILEGRRHWDAEVFRNLGYQPGEVEASNAAWESRIHPDDRAVVVASVERALRDGVLLTHEYRLLHPDGRIVWVHDRALPVHNAEGEVISIIGVQIDITAQREAQQRLLESEQRLRLAIEAAQAGTWDWQIDTDEVFWSDLNYRHLGYQPGEVRPSLEALLARIHPEDREIIHNAIGKDLRLGQPIEAEYRQVMPDGTIRWLRDLGQPLPDPTGRVSRVLGITFDITRHKEAEQSLQKTTHYLQGLQLIDRALLESVSAAELGLATLHHLQGIIPYHLGLIIEGHPANGLRLLSCYPQEISLREEGLPTFPAEMWYRNQIYRFDQASQLPEELPFGDRIIAAGIESMIAAPLVHRSSAEVMGWLVLFSDQRGAFSSDQGILCQDVAGQIAVALEVQRLHETVLAQKQTLERRVLERTEELLEVKERVEAILDSSVDAIVVASAQRGIQQINAAFGQQFGVSLDEYVNKPLGIIAAATEQGRISAALDSSWQGEPVRQMEVRARRATGEVFDAEISIARLALGQADEVVAVIRDVTERKRAASALLRQSSLLSGLADSTVELLSQGYTSDSINQVLRILGTRTAVDRVYVFQVGRDERSPHETISQRFEWARTGIEPQIDNPDLQGLPWDEGPFSRWRTVLQAGGVINALVSDLPADEQDVLDAQQILSLAIVPILIKGELWGMIGFDNCSEARVWASEEEAILRTASFIIGAVIEREDAYATLEQAEKRTSMMVEGLSEGVILLDGEGLIAHANPSAAHLIGVPIEGLIGRHITDWSAGLVRFEEDSPYSMEGLKQRLAQGLVEHIDDIILSLQPVGQEPRWLSVSVRPLKVLRGFSPGYTAVLSFADITQRRAALDAAITALNRERELGELKSRFVSMASHEFRTPLATILSSSEILTHYRARLKDEEITKRLDSIKSEVLYMTQLLDDVLTLGKAESGKLSFQPEEIDLAQMLGQFVGEFDRTQSHRLRLDLQGQCSGCRGDRKLLRQILSNLVSNALKYSPAQKPVDITLNCGPEKIVLTVRDQGIGIPEAECPQIFAAFHRARNVGTIPGTGLGLAIARYAVEMHNGDIDFTTSEGQGTSFRVTLPRYVLTDAIQERTGSVEQRGK